MKPKHSDSFLFPGLHHVAALQNEGFHIWDASRDLVFVSRPWVFLTGADAIGAPDITGLVSHHGRLHQEKPPLRISTKLLLMLIPGSFTSNALLSLYV
ncbi:hypothetical protein C2E23DRAFT_848708 [Lenzites betulinus]|nr:hypothetical protein C2E23DRAFT_848708 [Lenzites betulinus]